MRWMTLMVAGWFPAVALAQAGEKMTLEGFRIDRTEVTIGQFARYADARELRTTAEREGGGNEYVGGWQSARAGTSAIPMADRASRTNRPCI